MSEMIQFPSCESTSSRKWPNEGLRLFGTISACAWGTPEGFIVKKINLLRRTKCFPCINSTLIVATSAYPPLLFYTFLHLFTIDTAQLSNVLKRSGLSTFASSYHEHLEIVPNLGACFVCCKCGLLYLHQICPIGVYKTISTLPCALLPRY